MKKKSTKKKRSLFEQETTVPIVFYVHGAAITLSSSLFYVHGAVTRKPRGAASLVSVERDDVTGQVTLRIDQKKKPKA